MTDFSLLGWVFLRYQRPPWNEFIFLANILSFVCHIYMQSTIIYTYSKRGASLRVLNQN